MTIVGVVGHIRNDGLDVDPRPQAYFNYVQRAQDRMALVVRGTQDMRGLTQAIISAIRDVDPEQPVYDVLANVRMQQMIFELVLERFREIEAEARAGIDQGLEYPYLVLRYGLDFITWARDWYAEVERRLEAGEPLFELDDHEAARRESGLGAAG